MAKLSSKQRNKLPKSSFGMPGERKYPMPDKSHAANAKARASQQFHKGNISKSTEEAIFRKANAKMHKGHHGEVDGMKGHRGHTTDGKMAHMGVPHAGTQSKKHVGKHGGMLGQHVHGGTLSGMHSFHNIRHRDHHNKMSEG